MVRKIEDNNDYEVAIRSEENTIQTLKEFVDDLVVDSEETLGRAADLLKSVKKYEKDLDAKEKEFTKPLNDTLKKIREVFKPQKSAVEMLKRKIETEKILPYHRKLEEKRRKEAEERKAAEAEALRKKQEAALILAADYENEDFLDNAIKIEEKINKVESKEYKQESVKSSYSTTSISKRWTFDIEDPSQVPYEFCSPDATKIRKAVEGGVREIKGVKIYEKEVVSSR